MAQVDAGQGAQPAERLGRGQAATAERAPLRSGVGNPLDSLLRRNTAALRRRMIAGTVVAVVLLGAISVVLAVRQYNEGRSRALADLQARVVSVAAVVQTAFAGDIVLLQTAADAPGVRHTQLAAMDAYFRRMHTSSGATFSGGIAWVDRAGRVRATSLAAKPATFPTVAGRGYFRRVLATGKPYVSPGLVGRVVKQPIVVVAVPTFNGRGRLSGVLVGSILVKAVRTILVRSVRTNREAIDLGFAGLQLVDRDGVLLGPGLGRVVNRGLLERMKRASSGVLASTTGLAGQGGRVVAFAAASFPGWLVVIDRPGSAVFAPAEHALVLELASVGGALVLVFVILWFVARRARRDSDEQTARARSWSRLTRALSSASTPPEVAEALLGSLVSAFPAAAAVVAFETRGGVRVRAGSRLAFGERLAADRTLLQQVAQVGRDGPRSRPLERDEALRRILVLSGRRLRCVHALPISDEGGGALGTISLLSQEADLEASEWALLESFADQGAAALERARLFEHEHDLAIRLQRSLLPDRLPRPEGLQLAGHYHAGGLGVEVGGDWYDAIHRPDGRVQLCVGDVSGRGIGAATVMGRHRHSFHAYAYECVSPADIIRRMLRHVAGDEMVTVACVSFDPYTGELTYACAGHPPPLLYDEVTGDVQRLDGASAPPLGVAEAADIVEATLTVPGRATLALYTDGLVERRGENIDDAIDLLGRVIASASAVTPDAVIEEITAEIGAPVDDVALLIVTADATRAPFELELPAAPDMLPDLRRRLRTWLWHHRVESDESEEIVLAVSEACNNAIEHAYENREGTLRVSVRLEADVVLALVSDQGSWRDEQPSADRGRGKLLMSRLMDTAEIDTDATGTRVSMERRLRRHSSRGASLARSVSDG